MKYAFMAISIIASMVVLAITSYIDGNALNVDRWSAMDVAIRALLNGDYPYTAVDHLNGRTSNFPGLLILGIPFFLLGNVGYLQFFAFGLLAYTLYKVIPVKNALHYMTLLLISPAYWWEIFSISDLLSNIIIVFCFAVLVKEIFRDQIFRHPVLLGISTSFLTLTRGIVAIPLVLLIFKDFWAASVLSKLKYIASFMLTAIVLIAAVLFNCPDTYTLAHYNPLVLQTHYLPNYIHVIALLLPFYFSFRIKNFEYDYFKTTVLLMMFPTYLAFILTWFKVGFDTLLFKNGFDLSYLSMVLPFLLWEIIRKELSKNVLPT